MSKRWYIAPIIGTGVDNDWYRADIPVGINYSAIIPNKIDGTPKFNFALIIIGKTDHSGLLANSKYDVLPLDLDAALGAAARNAIINKLNARGIDTSRITAGTTVRDVLRIIGRFLHDSNWNETKTDCADEA